MRQFNYYGNYQGGQVPLGPTGVPLDEDVELLERQIESALRGGTGTGKQRQQLDQNIVNMTTQKNGQRTMTADTDVRGVARAGKRRKIPKHGSMSTGKDAFG